MLHEHEGSLDLNSWMGCQCFVKMFHLPTNHLTTITINIKVCRIFKLTCYVCACQGVRCQVSTIYAHLLLRKGGWFVEFTTAYFILYSWLLTAAIPTGFPLSGLKISLLSLILSYILCELWAWLPAFAFTEECLWHFAFSYRCPFLWFWGK